MSAAAATLHCNRQAPPVKPLPGIVFAIRLLQEELNRVGCGPSDANGSWDESSRGALAAFNKNAGTNLDAAVATRDALDAVRARSSRVCPLACAHGYRASSEQPHLLGWTVGRTGLSGPTALETKG
jgi:hypothetical protein